jgi:hypothetical protein
LSVFPSYYYYSIILFLDFKQFYTYFSLLTKTLSPGQTHHHHPHYTFMPFFHVCVLLHHHHIISTFVVGCYITTTAQALSLSLSLSLSHSCQLNMSCQLGILQCNCFLTLVCVYRQEGYSISVLICRWLWIGLWGCRCAEKDVIANEILGFGLSDYFFPLSYFEWTKEFNV